MLPEVSFKIIQGTFLFFYNKIREPFKPIWSIYCQLGWALTKKYAWVTVFNKYNEILKSTTFGKVWISYRIQKVQANNWTEENSAKYEWITVLTQYNHDKTKHWTDRILHA